MAKEWAQRRKLIYGLVVAVVLLVPFGLYLFAKYYEVPECPGTVRIDGRTVPCGGPCPILCTTSNQDLLVLWARTFRIGPGLHTAMAYVENRNQNAGVSELIYSMKLYDDENILIKERMGKTFANPGERFVILESRVFTDQRDPRRMFLEFQPAVRWERAPVSEHPDIIVRDRRLLDLETSPRMQVTLVNPALVPIFNIDVIVVLYDAQDNVVSANATFVDSIERDTSRTVYFTWSEPFPAHVARTEVIPRVDQFAPRPF